MGNKGSGHDASFEFITRLRNEILCCRIAPGTLLVESQIEADYGVSRAAVRSALRELSAQGLTRPMARVGHLVTTPTRQDAHEIFELREILEPWTARMAADKITESQIEDLRSLDYHVDSTDLESFSRSLEANRYFHLTVAKIAGNGRVTRVLTEVHEGITRLLHMGLISAVESGEMVDDHSLLVEALASHDGEKAEVISRQQVQDAYRMFDRSITGLFSSPTAPIEIPVSRS